MDYVYMLITLLGGLGVALVGMNLMSESMSKLAHGKMRNMLNKTANNRFIGVGIGAGVTGIIQSSAATTVMVVGLVNAGIMTLFQATAIIMGANIGTTITAQIASLSAFDFSSFFFLFSVIGVFITMFTKNEKLKILGSILTGLGLVFIGLELISGSIGDKKEDISKILSYINNPLLLLLMGVLVTALIQSSSALTSIVIGLAAAGVVVGGNGDGVYFVIIGSNIGTCVTALLSSIGASTNAKRASLIHLMFNLFGAIIFTIFLLLWRPFDRTFSGTVLEKLFNKPATQIAMFHTIFNVVCTLLFLPFIKVFVWITERIMPEKKKEDVTSELFALPDERLLKNTSVALGYFIQKTGKVFSYAVDALDVAFNAFLEKDESKKEVVSKINEDLVLINKQDVDYLVKLSSNSIARGDEETISKLHYVLNDILRIGELADNITKYTRHYVQDGLVFSDEFLTHVTEMFNKIKDLANVSLEAFLEKNYNKLKRSNEIEDEIDKARHVLNEQHIQRLKEGRCQPQNANVFTNLVGNLERAADHINYVARSIE